MGKIKAIETSYNGYRFRSRLEARWAVALDSLGCRWTYELQGFELNGTPYLPDFWIALRAQKTYPEGSPPERGFWLEIKPTLLTDEEEQLCGLLARHTRHCVYAAGGNVGCREFTAYKWSYCNGNLVSRDGPDAYSDSPFNCYNALVFYLVAEAATPSEGSYCYDFNRFQRAMAIARSARFEHGESGGRK